MAMQWLIVFLSLLNLITIIFFLWYVKKYLAKPSQDTEILALKEINRAAFLSLEEKLERQKEALWKNFSDLQENIHAILSQGRVEESATLNTAIKTLEERFEKLQVSNETRLNEIRQNVETRLTETIDRNFGAFKEMNERLGDLKTATVKIIDLSQGVHQLSSILESPKLRGSFGEFRLEEMLAEFVPADSYRLQEPIGNNQADAIILLREGAFCIDSKFPLENYRRLKDPEFSQEEKEKVMKSFESDVRTHVNDISTKYIIPGRTLDFAFMFIPAESIYYEIILRTELHDYMFSKKVVPVSPNSLHAYLQILAIGFRGMKIEQEAKRIEEILLGFKKYFEQLKENLRVLGGHIEDAQKKYHATSIDLQKVDTTLSGLELGKIDQRKEQNGKV